MLKSFPLVLALGLGLATAAAAQTTVAPADSDATVTVACEGPAQSISGEVSSPQGDTTDAIDYTVENVVKKPGNTGLFTFNAHVQCAVASPATRFTLPGGRTEIGCGTGKKQLFDMTLNANSGRTGRVTVQSAAMPGNQGAHAKYTLSFWCGVYRAN